MDNRYVVKQFIETVEKGFLCEIYSSNSQGMAQKYFNDLKQKYPHKYFELVEIIHVEKCLEFADVEIGYFGKDRFLYDTTGV